jgi:hypothetical protein
MKLDNLFKSGAKAGSTDDDDFAPQKKSFFGGMFKAADQVSDALVGSPVLLGEYYFPPDLIAGCCPRVRGDEKDIAWNAAAEACDTERIHIIWHPYKDRIWYLAVRSSELASHPNTWCPFASLLPGIMKNVTPPPVCYTYYTDEIALMLTVSQDTLQIHRGTSSVIRAKAERTARELNNAPVVELVPDKISQLTPVPWYSASMFEDRARRVLATFSVFGAIALAALAFFVWFYATMATISYRSDLSGARERTEQKSQQLMTNVMQLRASPMRDQLARFTEVNDGLIALGGLMEVYEIVDNKPRWRAVVPPNVTAERIKEINGQMIENSDAGVVIGNDLEVVRSKSRQKP